jgi:hypothetical protein
MSRFAIALAAGVLAQWLAGPASAQTPPPADASPPPAAPRAPADPPPKPAPPTPEPAAAKTEPVCRYVQIDNSMIRKRICN